jgi:hypothetical protein
MYSGFPEVVGRTYGTPRPPVRGVTRTKLVAVAQRVLSNTLLTTFFASKYSSANWRANRHWRS